MSAISEYFVSTKWYLSGMRWSCKHQLVCIKSTCEFQDNLADVSDNANLCQKWMALLRMLPNNSPDNRLILSSEHPEDGCACNIRTHCSIHNVIQIKEPHNKRFNSNLRTKSLTAVKMHNCLAWAIRYIGESTVTGSQWRFIQVKIKYICVMLWSYKHMFWW